MRRSAWLAGFLLAIATRAQAEPPLPLQLRLQAPPECGSGADIRAELQRSARVRPGFGLTPVIARAEVEHRGAGYALRLHTEHDGEAGERSLRAPDCATLMRSLTLVLALTFGPGVELGADAGSGPAAAAARPAGAGPTGAGGPAGPLPPAGKPGRQAGTPASAVPQPRVAQASPGAATRVPDAPAAASASRGRSRARLALMLGGGVEIGLASSVSPAVTAGAALELAALSIELRASGWPVVSRPLAPDLSARFDGLGGQLQACWQWPLAALALAACGGARAAAVRGRSSGAPADGSAVAPWYALSGAAAVSWPRGRWLSLRAEAALAASLDRPRYVIAGFGQARRVPLLLPSFDLLLVARP